MKKLMFALMMTVVPVLFFGPAHAQEVGVERYANTRIKVIRVWYEATAGRTEVKEEIACVLKGEAPVYIERYGSSEKGDSQCDVNFVKGKSVLTISSTIRLEAGAVDPFDPSLKVPRKTFFSHASTPFSESILAWSLSHTEDLGQKNLTLWFHSKPTYQNDGSDGVQLEYLKIAVEFED